LVASLGCVAMFAAASALANDVGLINHLAGDVSYTSGKSTDKAKPFMKVREGDRLNVAPGAQLRVVYFQNGRQESYTGPASFTAGTDDITPELYLYSVLQVHLLYNDMKVVVSEMQRRQPANPDVAVMVEYVKVKTQSQ